MDDDSHRRAAHPRHHNLTADSLTPRVAFTGFAFFVLLGGTAAIFGPTLPAFRATFGLSTGLAGLILSGHFAGSVVGILLSNVAPRRVRVPRAIGMGGASLFLLGCILIAVAPVFVAAIVGAGIEGIGWGMLVIVFNTLFASGFGRRSPAMLTVLNAVYGVGAILSPFGVGLFASTQFRLPFLAVALLTGLLLPFAWMLPRQAPSSTPGADAGDRFTMGPSHLIIGFMLAFFLYGGLEGGIAAWEPTNLIATGLSVSHAASVTALFWTTFTIGRLLAASLSLRYPPGRIVVAGLVGVAFTFGLARIAAITALAYTVSGLALAPVFPLTLIWAGRSIPLSSRTTSLLIASDLFGGVVLSALLGRLITVTSAASLPIAFSTIAIGELCILVGIQMPLLRSSGKSAV